MCLSVCCHVTGRCSVETDGRIELFLRPDASVDLSCTLLFKTFQVSVKISALASGTRHDHRDNYQIADDADDGDDSKQDRSDDRPQHVVEPQLARVVVVVVVAVVSNKCIAVRKVATLLYGNSHATWDHTVLPATRQR